MTRHDGASVAVSITRGFARAGSSVEMLNATLPVAVVGVAGWWSGPSAAMGIGALALCHAAWAAWRGRPPVGLVTALVCGLAPGPAVLAAAVGAAAGAAALRPVDVRLLAPIAVVAAARLAVGWAS